MNNNTKKANIMPWSKFKKIFNPQLFSTSDGVFGTKSIVHPTMTGKNLKFRHVRILDIDEHYNYNPPKPLEIVKDNIDVFSFTNIVYYVWKHRDGSGKGIDIYYL